MKRGQLILALVFLLIPIVFSQETPTYIWNPRDNLCQIMETPETSYGYLVVPSCETEWSLDSFLTPDTLSSVCLHYSDVPSQNLDCPSCPSCPTCELINKNTCAKYCPTEKDSALAPSLDTSEPGLVQTYLGSYIPIDILVLGIVIVILLLIYKIIDMKKDRENVVDSYKKTYMNYMLLREKYEKLFRVKEPLVKPEEINKK